MRTTAEHAATADLVARVTVRNIDTSAVGGSSADPVIYTMETSWVWQGPNAATYRISSSSNGASCGLEGISVGQELILFARKPDGSLPAGNPRADFTANLCGGTTVFSPALADEVTSALGLGEAWPAASTTPTSPVPVTASASATASAAEDLPSTAPSSTAPSFGAAAIPLAVLGALAAGGFVAWLTGRRRAG